MKSRHLTFLRGIHKYVNFYVAEKLSEITKHKARHGCAIFYFTVFVFIKHFSKQSYKAMNNSISNTYERFI